MEKFDYDKHWQKFINGNIVITCTFEDKIDLLKFLQNQGYKWNSGNTMLTPEGELQPWDKHTNKNNNIDSTYCYNTHRDKVITQAHMQYFIDNGKEVVYYREDDDF